MPASLRIIQGANRTLGRVAPRVVARLNQRLFTRPRRFTPREWELDFETMGVRTRLPNGASLLSAGEGARTVALIHGWEGRATQFAPMAAALVQLGYRVVGVDGPAHGHSRGRTADPYAFAETLLEVQERVGALHGVVGHSMGGGSIAIALAAGLQPSRAVLIASPASLHDVLHRFAHTMHMPARATSHFVEALRRAIMARGHRDVDLLQFMATCDVPALVIHARDDREVPHADGERIAAAWPRARLESVEGLGHRRILRAPPVVHAVCAFLDQSRGAST